MNLIEKVVSLFKTKNKAALTPNIALAKKNGKQGLLYRLKRIYHPQIDFQIDKWREAIDAAEDPIRPRREFLYEIYRMATLDAQLSAQLRIAHITVQRSNFEVHKDGKEDDKLTALFKTTWFNNYLRHCVDAEFYGHSLIEFNMRQRNEQGEFTQIMLIPRDHVRPEEGLVVIQVHDERGFPYRERPYNNFTVEIGDPYDLGILKIAAKETIYKRYARKDWSIRSEKFGMPFLVVRTQTRDEKELNEKENMAANFGANGYAILDDTDEIELLEPKATGGHDIYKAKADYCDQQIAKLINGQTGASDEKAYVGSAEVHERILNDFAFERLRTIEFHINDVLFPFLIRHGYALQGAAFRFTDLIQKDKSDNPSQKKKLSKFHKLHLAYEQQFGERLDFELDSSIDLGKLVKKVFDKKLAAGDLDQDTYLANLKALEQAIDEGFAKLDIGYKDPRFELSTQFKHNIQVFAAFKNYDNIADLVQALRDETGAVRSWADYQEVATSIVGKYNQVFLQAEYQHALASTQIADQWVDFEANKDLLPYLRYRTQKDGRVRPSHAVLDGITLPVDDPFWDNYAPKNGWRCRCNLIQVADGLKRPSKQAEAALADVHPIFQNNAARSKEIFNAQHPYLAALGSEYADTILSQKNLFVYRNFDKDTHKKVRYDKQTGSFLVQHKKHGASEVKDNRRIASKLLSQKHNAIELIEDIPNTKSPDAIWNGKLWEFKSVRGNKLATAVQNRLRKGKHQAGRILLYIDVDNYNKASIIRGMSNAVKFDRDSKIQEVALLFRSGQLVLLDRDTIVAGDYEGI